MIKIEISITKQNELFFFEETEYAEVDTIIQGINYMTVDEDNVEWYEKATAPPEQLYKFDSRNWDAEMISTLVEETSDNDDDDIMAIQIIFEHLKSDLSSDNVSKIGESAIWTYAAVKVVDNGFERTKYTRKNGTEGTRLGLEVYQNDQDKFRIVLWDVSDDDFAALQSNMYLELWHCELKQYTNGIEIKPGMFYTN